MCFPVLTEVLKHCAELSQGAIAGIVIGSIVGVGLIVCGVFIVVRGAMEVCAVTQLQKKRRAHAASRNLTIFGDEPKTTA